MKKMSRKFPIVIFELSFSTFSIIIQSIIGARSPGANPLTNVCMYVECTESLLISILQKENPTQGKVKKIWMFSSVGPELVTWLIRIQTLVVQALVTIPY